MICDENGSPAVYKDLGATFLRQLFGCLLNVVAFKLPYQSKILDQFYNKNEPNSI